ncbi:MAG: hypothetical protein HKN36_05880 [Hellea sp.]|nr:hypothetical protein [Hellea sp.]
MKLQEGPAFGALLIGSGVGFLVWKKTGNPLSGFGIGIALLVIDYLFVVQLKKLFKK